MINTIEYKSIRNVINYIPDIVIKEEKDNDQIFSWANQALKMISPRLLKGRLVKDIVFSEIINHSAEIPKKVHSIWRVTYNSNPLDISTCKCDDLQNLESKTVDDCVPIYHTLFLNSDEYRNNWKPLRYTGKTLTDNFVCNVDTSGCSGTWTLSESRNYVKPSFASGYVAVEFHRLRIDEDGYPMISDIPQLFMFLAHFAVAQHWYNRASSGEANANQMYLNSLNTAKAYKIEAEGILIQSGISYEQNRAVVYAPRRIVKANQLI